MGCELRSMRRFMHVLRICSIRTNRTGVRQNHQVVSTLKTMNEDDRALSQSSDSNRRHETAPALVELAMYDGCSLVQRCQTLLFDRIRWTSYVKRSNVNIGRIEGFVLLAVLLTAIPHSIGADEPRLYGAYAYGYPVSELEKESGAFDCSDDMGSGHWICIENQQFVDHEVLIAFKIQDGLLVSILLFAEFSEQAYADFLGAMTSKFDLVLLGDGESTYDLLHNSKRKDRNTMMQEVGEFEREALLGSSVSYTFVEKSAASSLEQFANLTDLVGNVDPSRRFADFQVTTDLESVFLSVHFYMPGKQLNTIKASIEREYDDF